MKVSELTGARLDYWVGRAYALDVLRIQDGTVSYVSQRLTINVRVPFSPSTDWAVGGPIIEHEGICIAKLWEPVDGPIMANAAWTAMSLDDKIRQDGPTPLVAAMRAFVLSKFGAEVPDAV